MLTLGKVSRPEAESAGCKKTRVFFESVQRTQTLLAELDTRKAIGHFRIISGLFFKASPGAHLFI